MIVHVNYVYSAKVLAPRQRNSRVNEYLASAPVEIREMSSEQAPVAFRFVDGSIGRHFGVPQEVRMVEGRLYRACHAEKSAARRNLAWLLDRAESAFAKSLDNGDDPFHVGPSFGRVAENFRPIEDDREVARVEDASDREVRAARIARYASEMLLVDGVPHELCLEPVYRVVAGDRDNGYRPSVSCEYLNPNERRQEDSDRMYRADEAELIASRLEPGEFPEADRIQVLIPEAVRYDAPARSVHGVARIVRDHLKERIARRDETYFSFFRRLRDAVDGYETELEAANARMEADPFAEPADAGPLAALTVEAAEGAGIDEWLVEKAKACAERLDALAVTRAFDVKP